MVRTRTPSRSDTPVWHRLYTQGMPDGCWYGCTLSCAHGVDHFHLQTGPYKDQVVLVDGPEYETIAGEGSNIGVFDPLAIIEMNFYCDTYGIDTISFGNSVAFVMECYAEGILNEEITGGLKLNWGNAEAALELLHQMARGEGFGLIVGQGVRYMKQYFAEQYGADPQFLQDIGMEVKGMEISEYMTKESLAQQGGYGMAIKGAQHDEAWLIFMDMVRKQLPTFEAKAEALHYFPLVADLVQPAWAVQAALERHPARQQCADCRAAQGAGARRKLLPGCTRACRASRPSLKT